MSAQGELSLACPWGGGGTWAPGVEMLCVMCLLSCAGLWMCSCTGITEGVSGSAELRPHFCLFYLQKRGLGRRFPVNINVPKGLESGRFLSFKGGTDTHSPHTDCWMSGRHLEMFVGFDGFVILSLALGCEQKWRLLLPCPAGKALTFSSPEHPEQRAL